MDQTVKIGAALCSVFACVKLFGLSAADCGGDTNSDQSPPDGSTVDANVDGVAWDASTADSSPGADGAASCQHRDECEAGSASCENACGLPCTCTYFVTRYEWRCYLPVSGSFCDPNEHGSCFYPPDTQTDGKTCGCSALAAEHVWYNCSDETVCPEGTPGDAASCATFAAGIQCSYPLPGGLDRTCECKLAGSGKLWSCFPP